MQAFKDVRTENGSSQGQNRALASVLCSKSLGSGDRLRDGERYRESRRCSRDAYPESNITKYTSIRRKPPNDPEESGSSAFSMCAWGLRFMVHVCVGVYKVDGECLCSRFKVYGACLCWGSRSKVYGACLVGV